MDKNPLTSYLIISAITLLLTFFTCWTYWRTHRTQKTRFTIVCTTTILADTVKNLVGDHASVISLMGPGVDPHVYRARESDLHTLLSADLIIYNGLHLEGRMADILQTMPTIPTVAAADGISRAFLLESAEFPGLYDPHIWFDVALWIEVVRYLSAMLIQYNPCAQDFYRNRAHTYLEQLTQLDHWVQHQIATIDMHKRILITAHDAFGYFGRRYALRVVGLQGISTDSEAAITDIHHLTKMIVEHRIPSIFLESSVSPRALHAVQKAVEADNFQVRLGDELYSDTLGIPGSNADTYCTMIQHNIQAIVNGLH